MHFLAVCRSRYNQSPNSPKNKLNQKKVPSTKQKHFNHISHKVINKKSVRRKLIFFFYLVRHGLKKDRCCWNFLLLCHEAMCQVTSIRKVKSHDPTMGLNECRVDSKVSGRTLKWAVDNSVMRRVLRRTLFSGSLLRLWYGTWVWLNVHTPFLWVQTVGLQCSLLTKSLQLIHMLCSTIIPEDRLLNVNIFKKLLFLFNTYLWNIRYFPVPLSRISLWILVVHTWTQSLQNSSAGKVLRRNQLQAIRLPVFLFFDDWENLKCRRAQHHWRHFQHPNSLKHMDYLDLNQPTNTHIYVKYIYWKDLTDWRGANCEQLMRLSFFFLIQAKTSV